MKAITIKTEIVGDSTFYINEVINKGVLSYNFNRVNEKTNRTYHYKNESDYNKAIKKAMINHLKPKTMEHTQGQWEMEYHECRKTYDDTIYPMQIATAETYICQRVEGLTKEQSIANAKLIASAPELLDALKSVLEFVPKMEQLATWERAEQAIKKATN